MKKELVVTVNSATLKVVVEGYTYEFFGVEEEDTGVTVLVNDNKVTEFTLRTYCYEKKFNGYKGGFFLWEPTRGQRRKQHVLLRKKLGLNKKEYCNVMGRVGGFLSHYLSCRGWF